MNSRGLQPPGHNTPKTIRNFEGVEQQGLRRGETRATVCAPLRRGISHTLRPISGGRQEPTQPPCAIPCGPLGPASGRTTSKTRGTDVATYTWGFGNFLLQVDSDFPDEGLVDYEYGGNMQRRSRDDGTAYTWFNWAGGAPINEEAAGTGVGDGALTNTLIGKLAELGGNNPATGTESYYMMDHLGSVRGIFDGSDTMTGRAEFSPFGSPITAQLPAGFDPRYTVHHLDPASGLYYAPFRYLNPATGRWLKRDPLGMIDGPNMYGYVGGNPVRNIDPAGGVILVVVGVALGAWAIYGLGKNAIDGYYAAKDAGLQIRMADHHSKEGHQLPSAEDRHEAATDSALRVAEALAEAVVNAPIRPTAGGGLINSVDCPLPASGNRYQPPNGEFTGRNGLPLNFPLYQNPFMPIP